MNSYLTYNYIFISTFSDAYVEVNWGHGSVHVFTSVEHSTTIYILTDILLNHTISIIDWTWHHNVVINNAFHHT